MPCARHSCNSDKDGTTKMAKATCMDREGTVSVRTIHVILFF